jgi:hypothetical protein
MSAPTTAEWLRAVGPRVYQGSSILCWRIARRLTGGIVGRARRWRKGIGGWLGESDGILDTALRWGLLLGGGWLAWRLGHVPLALAGRLVDGRAWLLWPAAAVWLVAAYRAGDPRRKPAAHPEVESGTGGEEPGPAAPVVPRAVFLALLHRELADARAVHLWHLAERLAKQYPDTEWDVPAVAALCEATGVPVTPKIRAHGKGATRGVEKTALPPLPAPIFKGPVVDVDAAGQQPSTGASTSTSTGSSTSTVGAPGEGSGRRFVCVDDPTNPARTHVIWRGSETA